MGKTLAHGSRKRRHSYVADIGNQNSMGETAGLNQGGPIFCRSVWHSNRDLALAAVESRDLNLMIATDAEVCRLRRYDGLGIYREQEFARANPRLKCNTIFYYVHEHPTLPVNRVDWAQCRVDGVG